MSSLQLSNAFLTPRGLFALLIQSYSQGGPEDTTGFVLKDLGEGGDKIQTS